MSKLSSASRVLLASAAIALAIPAAIAEQKKETNSVADPYLWLEDVTGDKAQDWARQQNARTDAEPAAGPECAKLQADILAIQTGRARRRDRGGQYVSIPGVAV